MATWADYEAAEWLEDIEDDGRFLDIVEDDEDMDAAEAEVYG